MFGSTQEEWAPGQLAKLKSAQFVPNLADPDQFKLVFTFIGKPSAHNVNHSKKKMEITFYDAELGAMADIYLRGGPVVIGRVDAVEENFSEIEEVKKKEMHKALKITLELTENFSYEVASEHNVFTLSSKKREPFPWKKVVLGTLIIGGGGTLIYFTITGGSGTSWE